jgi:hypothetical protein
MKMKVEEGIPLSAYFSVQYAHIIILGSSIFSIFWGIYNVIKVILIFNVA